jgi:hypothetical protein
MSTATNPHQTGSLPVPLSTTSTPSSTPLSRRITRAPESLREFDTSRPILRFDFPDAATQSSFHRAFALLRTKKDKAAVMQRFFDNYDGVVSIPKVPARWDTSGDMDLARKLQAETPLPDTRNDILLAQHLMDDESPPPTVGDAELARQLQGESSLPVTNRDVQLARHLQEETPLLVTDQDEGSTRVLQQENPQPNTRQDEDIARHLQSDNSHHTGRDQNTDWRPQSNTERSNTSHSTGMARTLQDQATHLEARNARLRGQLRDLNYEFGRLSYADRGRSSPYLGNESGWRWFDHA